MWKIMVISELSFTCKCSLTNHIPGAGGMTKQEWASVTKNNRHSTSSHVFTKTAHVALKTASAEVSSECGAQRQCDVR